MALFAVANFTVGRTLEEQAAEFGLGLLIEGLRAGSPGGSR